MIYSDENIYYPKELFCSNVLVTEENKRQYRKRKEAIYKKCLELCPDYHDLPINEQWKIRHVAELEV